MFETEQKLRKARAGLILDQPFFGALALRLQLQEDPSAGTAWTDGKSLGYDPTWIKGLTLDQVKGLWAHVILHCACAHHVRRGQRDGHQRRSAGDRAEPSGEHRSRRSALRRQRALHFDDGFGSGLRLDAGRERHQRDQWSGHSDGR